MRFKFPWHLPTNMLIVTAELIDTVLIRGSTVPCIIAVIAILTIRLRHAYQIGNFRFKYTVSFSVRVQHID